MTDDSPDTFLGALFQLIFGLAGTAFFLALMGASLVLLVALMGASFNIFLGNAPGILEPFGGALAGLLADFVKLLGNVTMVVIAIVMLWLMATGQMDDIFDEQQSSNSQRKQSGGNRTSAQNSMKHRPKSSDGSASLADSRNSADTIEPSDDTEFDKYGQIREK